MLRSERHTLRSAPAPLPENPVLLVFTAESVTPSRAAFLASPGFAIVMPMRI